MNWNEYRIETLRTLPDLGSLLLNSIHMTSGIMTELIEVDDLNTIDKYYSSHFADEIGDVFWYISNYCNFHDIEIDESTREIRGIPNSLQSAGKLLDFDKKLLAYNKPYNREMQIRCINNLFVMLRFRVMSHGLNLDTIFNKNIEKLKIRFPEKFSGEQAINKNEQKEKEVFK